MWEQHPDSMSRALVRHDMILRHVIESHGGTVFKTVGDQFCATFDSPASAIAAAVAGQVNLQSQKWEEHTEIRTRMSIHYGPAQARSNDFFGTTVNKVARLLSTAHGSQIVVSSSVAALVEGSLSDGISLLDMGTHRLKDLQQAEQIYQVLHPQLPTEFPPLKTLNPETNNLPIQLTSFIGREAELAEIKTLVGANRLVTLSGTGGSGKTRLAIQVAGDLIEDFPDGVWLVELAPIADPNLVAPSMAAALGLRESAERPILKDLIEHCKSRKLMLILDNCEHVIQQAAQVVGSLMASAPGLKILATSREPFSIPGEKNWRIPSMKPLDPEDLEIGVDLFDAMGRNDAARLFVERATQVSPAFELTPENAEPVAQICHRLDGIPLAIELAAARVKVLPVEQIATRLDDRFRLLTGGSRTALPRQQTLRALIDWSYELLADNEKAMLRRLSVFAGGWTLEAAEAIAPCDAIEAWEVLDLLGLLVDKSLVTVEEGVDENRYGMLQTVRQYGRELVTQLGEEAEVRTRHLEFFSAMAGDAAKHLQGPQQATYLKSLAQDRHNLRAAVDYAKESAPDIGLKLTADLWRYWLVHSHFTEGREVLAELIQANSGQPTSEALARALQGAGVLAVTQNDYPAAADYLERCLEVCRENGYPEYESAALNSLGNLFWRQGDYPKARELYTRSLELEQSRGNDTGVARAYISLGNVATQQADFPASRELYQKALQLSRAIKNSAWEAAVLHNLGDVEWSLANFPEAGKYYEESLGVRDVLGDRLGKFRATVKLGSVAMFQGNLDKAEELFTQCQKATHDLGDHLWEAITTANLGDIAFLRGDPTTALAKHLQAYDLRVELDDKWGLANSLTSIGNILAALGRHEDAARFYGCSTALREEIGAPLPPVERIGFDKWSQVAKEALGDDGYEKACLAGQSLTISDARKLAGN